MSDELFETVKTSFDGTPAGDGVPRPEERRRAGWWGVHAVLCLTAFLITARVLRPHYPEDWQLRAKLKHFEQQGGQYDIVFFGSSRFLRAISPTVFEHEMAQQGHPLTAFNFGIGPMRPHEMNQLIRQTIVDGPHRPRWAVIEVMDWQPTFLPAMRSHERTVRWHTSGETLNALRTTWRANLILSAKIDQSIAHIQNWIAQLTNYGRGPQWLDEIRDDDGRDRAEMQWIAAGQGYRALDDEPGPRAQQRRESFLKNYANRFLTDVQSIPETNAQPGSLRHLNIVAWQHQQQMLNEAGIVPIYVIPALRWGTPDLNQLVSRAHLEHAFRYNDPQKYPELYARDLYWDRGHYDKRGAAVFSRQFALDFTRWINRASPR